MGVLDLLLREDLSIYSGANEDAEREESPPESLLAYIKEIRRFSLDRRVRRREERGGKGMKDGGLPRHVAVGMVPKKIHEVSCFASFISDLATDIEGKEAVKEITHFVDFGSGQNYLGRTLASPLYGKHVVAVESKEGNIRGAMGMDVFAGVAEREKVRRNKKVWRAKVERGVPEEELDEKARRRRLKDADREETKIEEENGKVDLRPNRELKTIYTAGEGKGYIQYVEHRLQSGDLSNVVAQIETTKQAAPNEDLNILSETNRNSENLQEVTEQLAKDKANPTRIMALSIHSCGNLSHHGIRSLLLNPSVHAIAIIGCCYNLLTERLAPISYKHPHLRPNLRAINAPRVDREAGACEEHGFPMSERVGTYGVDGEGIRLNITARMMAVQAPRNWTAKESDAFFTRHFYRALLQKVFLDRGVVSRINRDEEVGPASTEPVIIGSLRKGCYGSFVSYVRGALQKLSNDPERGPRVLEKMGEITDEEIEGYVRRYAGKKKELSVTWSLMAFSAGVVESLIVVDRWLFLREHPNIVGEAWVEAVFDYGLSPRNLVVVGIKK